MATPSVEVKCLDTFAYYPAFLKDYNNSDQVLVGYPNAWKADEWVLLENVRNGAPEFDATSFAPQAGDVVEAQAKSSDDEPYSWWKATVKTVRGEFYMISYSSWEDEFNEILERDMLRPFNKNPPLRPSDISKLELALPRDLRESGTLDVRQLNSVLETSGALSVHVDPKKQVLVILGNATSVKRAQLLAGMAFKHLGEIQRLKERTLRHQDNLQTLKQRLNEGHLEVFNIQSPELVGLVIGVNGKNIKRVEKMSGVLNVRVDSAKSQVSILAKSEAEAKAAREQLEFVEQRFPILKRQAGRVVGKAFSNMDQIQKDSGVVRIRLDNPRHATSSSASPDETTDLIIIGTKETVVDALLLINHHMEFLNTVSQLTADEQSLNAEVRKMNIEAGLYENEQRTGRGGRGARGPRPQGQRQYSHNEFPPLAGDKRKGGNQQQQQSQPQQQSSQQQSQQSTPAAAGAADNEERKEGGRGRGRGRGGNAAGGDNKQQQSQQQPQQQQQRQQKQQQAQPQAAAAAATSAAAPADASADAQQGQQQQGRRGRGRGQKKDGAAGDAASPAPVSSPSTATSAAAPSATPAQAGAAAPKQQNQRKQNQGQRRQQASDKPADAAAAAASPSASPDAASAAASATSPSGDKPKQQQQQQQKKSGGNSQRGQRRERQPTSDVAVTSPTPAADKKSEPTASPAPAAAAAAPAAASSPTPAAQ